MKFLLGALLLLLTIQWAQSKPQSAALVSVTANANKFVDDLLTAARKYIIQAKLDPLKLPDEEDSFSKTILWVNWHGHASLTEGTAAGVSTVHRTGDADAQYLGEIIDITAKCGVDSIVVQYHVEAEFMGMGPNFHLTITTETPSVNMELLFNMTAIKGTIKTFIIEDVGKIDLEFQGLGKAFDWLGDVIGGWVVNLFKGKIMEKIEEVAREEIQKAMDSIPPPTELYESLLQNK